MINARAVDKIERHVRDAVAARRTRRRRRAAPGASLRPELLRADGAGRVPTPTMACSCEETFGPVVPVTRFETEAEVHRRGERHAVRAGGVLLFAATSRRIWRVADALEAGLVGINEGALAAEAAPFGGVKESGYGREGSVHGLDDYLHLKYLCQGQL